MVGAGTHANGIAGSSRSRRNLLPEEDATKLQFGDFADGEALTPMDVKKLLEVARGVGNPNAPPPPDNKVYKSAVEYIDEFSNAEPYQVDSMRQSLTVADPDDPLHGFFNKFEIAQIIYLRPTTVEAAVSLIPSLDRYRGSEQEEDLRSLLSNVDIAARYAVKPENQLAADEVEI